MKFNKISVYPREDFEVKMYLFNLDNDNVSNSKDKAFIQILETPNCIKYYEDKYGNEGETRYWFNKCNSDNVLNIAFDDINDDTLEWNSIILHGISDEQADEIVKFIDKHIGKDFFISCRAGKSRSQAICRYILDIYGDRYGYGEKESCRKENPCLTPNINVVTKLKRAYYKIHGLFE